MVNNTLNGALMELGETMARNLEAMGVTDANPNDGLTTLAGRILNVEPSIKGLNLDTSLVITTTQEIIGLGESIILTSTLRASYDDTTVVDVDLSGVLTGATVKFYNGTTLLGTSITDLNGIATYTYTPSQLGNFTFHTVFEGTENFTNCNSSNVNVTVINSPTSLVLEADKSILSHYDNDNCTLTATLYDNNNTPMEGLSVVFKNGDIVLATITTNSNGVATYTYNSQGVGDVTITAECMNLQETYSISDIYWYSNDGTKCSGTYSTGTDGDYHYITSIGTDLLFPSVPTGNFELSMKAYRPTTLSGRALLLEFGASKSDTLLCGWDEGSSSSAKNVRIYRRSGTSNTSVLNNTNPDYNNEEWVDFKLRFENSTVTLTIGGTSISTSRSSVSRIGNYDSSSSRLSEMQIRTL